jgi:hypothetical protein
MTHQIFRRPYRVRKAARWGKEITIAPDAKLEPGDEVVQWYDGFVLIVPQGARVDEEILRRAIRLGRQNAEPRDR